MPQETPVQLDEFDHKILIEPDDTKRAVLIVVADMARRFRQGEPTAQCVQKFRYHLETIEAKETVLQ